MGRLGGGRAERNTQGRFDRRDSRTESTIAQRLGPLRQALAERSKNRQRVTVLLVTRAGPPKSKTLNRYPRSLRHRHRTRRRMLRSGLYLAIMWPLEYWVLDEKMIHPCGGRLSGAVDLVMIGWLTVSTV